MFFKDTKCLSHTYSIYSQKVSSTKDGGSREGAAPSANAPRAHTQKRNRKNTTEAQSCAMWAVTGIGQASMASSWPVTLANRATGLAVARGRAWEPPPDLHAWRGEGRCLRGGPALRSAPRSPSASPPMPCPPHIAMPSHCPLPLLSPSPSSAARMTKALSG